MAIHSLPSAGEELGDDIVAEINITPLTDIFLVLLIIFMVTTSVISAQGKDVDLPSSAIASATPSGVNVTVTAEGEIQIEDRVVREAALEPELRAALQRSKDKIVVLRGDRKVLLGEAVNILDVAQKAGASGIALATKPPGPGQK
ncbi:MAG TPA: biopolymer transporter ExbD [Myxococcota bacterium]|jgi:biopolymer transport protein ExbD|nr:biopolymer transporter ExbD [Myxococcota bacterium]